MSQLQNRLPSDPSKAAVPRVLVADDDPASLRFLCDSLCSLGAQISAHADGDSALSSAREETFDLLLLDRCMPNAGALQVLTSLRSDSTARSTESFAVASSAEITSADRNELLTAGFGEVLLKPCTLVDLQRLLAMALPDNCRAFTLDDQAALISSGDASTMQALRQLLRAELNTLQQELDVLSSDRGRFNDRLHRLRSSCGFCGASALAAQAAVLQKQLAVSDTASVSLAHFRRTLQATLDALIPQSGGGLSNTN
ncbi:MAG: response regulator [Rhodanobacter sp.]